MDRTFPSKLSMVCVVTALFLLSLTFLGYSRLTTYKTDTNIPDRDSNLRFASTVKPATYSALKGESIGVDTNNPIKTINSKYFESIIQTASQSPRKRKMIDLTKDPTNNSMQVLMNTWLEGSYSPVHKHPEYSELFVILEGSLAFFTFSDDGKPKCNVISTHGVNKDKAIVIESNTWHAMTAAPRSLGYPGHAIVFEVSGHKYDEKKQTKALAPFAPSKNNGLDGDETYYSSILGHCSHYNQSIV